MTSGPEIAIAVDQNPYLAPGAGRVDAVVTVTATGGGAPTDALEIIIIDCSGSMAGPKMRAAQQATAAAIVEVRDGASFAVIAGAGTAQQVYPATGTARADDRTRAEAIARVDRLQADGATAIGAWLRLARWIADAHPDAVRHAILLTDGQNGEKQYVFHAAVQECVGAFVCDCRGVGTDWRVEELRTVASALLGSVDIVARPEGLAADFRALTGAAMGKNVPDVWLRLWTPQGATVRFVKQVAPTVEDLTDRRVDAGRQRGGYPLGAWGAETRDYHLCVEVAAGATGAQLRAARVELVRGRADRTPGDDVLGQANVTAEWTDDVARSSAIDPRVAHYTGQVALAGAIADGLAARDAGDVAGAEARLGEAVRLAEESGHTDTARLLEGVVQVLDAKTGTVRLRADADKAGTMALDARRGPHGPGRPAELTVAGGGMSGAMSSGGTSGGGAGGTCPQGHASDDPDWCDVCGLAMVPGPVRAAATPAPSPAPLPGHGPGACVVCGAVLEGRFCEECGHDSLAPAVPGSGPVRAVPSSGPVVAAPAPGPPAAGPGGSRTWRAVVRADRAWFDEVRRQDGVNAADLEFPRYTQERRFVLSGAQVSIGRRSASRGIDPDIDLTGLDPAVSSAHALLLARPGGGWELVDVGSTNGTTLDVEDGPIPAHRPVPAAEGTVIRLGAWTTITLTADPPAGP